MRVSGRLAAWLRAAPPALRGARVTNLARRATTSGAARRCTCSSCSASPLDLVVVDYSVNDFHAASHGSAARCRAVARALACAAAAARALARDRAAPGALLSARARAAARADAYRAGVAERYAMPRLSLAELLLADDEPQRGGERGDGLERLRAHLRLVAASHVRAPWHAYIARALAAALGRAAARGLCDDGNPTAAAATSAPPPPPPPPRPPTGVDAMAASAACADALPAPLAPAGAARLAYCPRAASCDLAAAPCAARFAMLAMPAGAWRWDVERQRGDERGGRPGWIAGGDRPGTLASRHASRHGMVTLSYLQTWRAEGEVRVTLGERGGARGANASGGGGGGLLGAPIVLSTAWTPT